MQENPPAYRKEYRMDASWRFLLFMIGVPAFLMPLCLVGMMFVLYIPIGLELFLLYLMFSLIGGLALYDLWRYRIIVTAEGIKCFDWLSSFQILWSDIVGIRSNPTGYVLITKYPIQTSNRLVTVGRSHLGMSYHNSLSYYMWQWEHGGLKEDFQRYAPHLFSNSPVSSPETIAQ